MTTRWRAPHGASCCRAGGAAWTTAVRGGRDLCGGLSGVGGACVVGSAEWEGLLHPIPPSIRVFSSESTLHMRWPKYCSFSISSSNEYSGLISFRTDGLDSLVVQGTLKSLLQHHSSKASILWRSAFFIVQLSHPYIVTREPGRAPPRHAHGDLTSLAPHERLPGILVVPRDEIKTLAPWKESYDQPR